MARPKTLRAEPVSKSRQELLRKVIARIKADNPQDEDGYPLDVEEWDPVAELAAMSQDMRLKPADRLAALKEVAGYLHAKLGNVQVTGQFQVSHTLVKHEGADEVFVNDMTGERATKDQIEDPNAMTVVVRKFSK
jgi:hypothetical protein